MLALYLYSEHVRALAHQSRYKGNPVVAGGQPFVQPARANVQRPAAARLSFQ